MELLLINPSFKMHFSTITSALLLAMVTTPAIAKPVDMHSIAARAEGLYERAVEHSIFARHHKGATGNAGNANQAQQAQAQSQANTAAACAQTGNQKRQLVLSNGYT